MKGEAEMSPLFIASMIFISCMGLIIVDASLTAPPSWTSSFRDITLYCNVYLKHQIIVECDDPSEKDFYVSWLRERGAFDFVEDVLNFGEQLDGLRISTEEYFPPTIIIKRIVPETTWSILNQIKSY